MEIMHKIGVLFQSEQFIYYYQKLWIIGFWINVPVCLMIAFLIYRMGRKYDARKKEITEMINAPGMEYVRWRLDDKLKQHGIKPDDDVHKRN